jgi:5-methylcytosine-specific restriction endonuclease McrA
MFFMTAPSLSRLTNAALKVGLVEIVSQDLATTTRMLAFMGEFDARKLYLPAGYPSMYQYCLHELRMSEDMIAKRILAARRARRYPAIGAALEDGRLHLTAVVLLAPHLLERTVDELIAAAAHKTRAQIRLMLAERYPQADAPTLVLAVAPAGTALLSSGSSEPQQVPAPVVPSSAQESAVVMVPVPAQLSTHANVAPLSPGRYVLQVTVSAATHDKLRRAQELLGHAVPSGDVAQVLDRALDTLIEQLEKRKFAKTDRPQRAARRTSPERRHIPAHVKRAVQERDAGQCTFVSEAGRRCAATSRLEFDHIQPVARCGQTTVRNLRLRCRAHNQYSAEQLYGHDFMHGRRESARERTAAPPPV